MLRPAVGFQRKSLILSNKYLPTWIKEDKYFCFKIFFSQFWSIFEYLNQWEIWNLKWCRLCCAVMSFLWFYHLTWLWWCLEWYISLCVTPLRTGVWRCHRDVLVTVGPLQSPPVTPQSPTLTTNIRTNYCNTGQQPSHQSVFSTFQSSFSTKYFISRKLL